MNFGDIISNSVKYPFEDLKNLGFVCLLFVLLLILPIGIIIKNPITMAIGAAGLLVFILITPGYKILVIKSGINQSSNIPSIKVGRSIINTLKLLVLKICYVAIPSIIALIILLFATGLLNYPVVIFKSMPNLTFTFDLIGRFLNAIWITLMVTSIVRLIFSLLSYIAQARLANSNSLIEALKIHKVILDIKEIGFFKFIGWYIVMGILLAIISIIAGFVLFVPYVGFIIYLCIVMPIIYLIYNYSLGLLYSDFSYDEDDDDLDKFERELQYLKYGLLH